jgi:hypothetical protein
MVSGKTDGVKVPGLTTPLTLTHISAVNGEKRGSLARTKMAGPFGSFVLANRNDGGVNVRAIVTTPSMKTGWFWIDGSLGNALNSETEVTGSALAQRVAATKMKKTHLNMRIIMP